MTTPLRSERYLRWVRSHPCCICGATEGIHAHHHGRKEGGGGMGLKTCDLHTVPLCSSCHRQWHQHPTELADRALWRAAAVLLRRAYIEGVLHRVESEVT